MAKHNITQRNCKVCGELKHISCFRIRGQRTKTCTKCKYEIKAKKSQSKSKKAWESRVYYLYYLPEMHYVGISYHIERRIRDHRSKGKITDGWEIIATYSDPKLCALHEALLHYMGYNGSAYDSMIKTRKRKKRKYE